MKDCFDIILGPLTVLICEDFHLKNINSPQPGNKLMLVHRAGKTDFVQTVFLL